MIRLPLFPAVAMLVWALSACSTVARPAPEPIIRTVEVKVPVAVPCPSLATLGAAPAYPDTDEALGAAANLFERVKLLLAGRVLRLQRETSVTAVAKACG